MGPIVTPGIESLRPYEAGKPLEELARELGITDAVKLASNENPYGPSPRALEAARAALSEVHRYPDAAAHRLRHRLAEHHGISADEIVHGNGSNELIELLVRTFTTAAHHLVYAAPSFVVYQSAALVHGVSATAVPLRDETHDLDAMLAAIRPETRLVFVANPNNPTGTHVGREALGRFLRAVPESVIVAVDEAYVEFADAPDFSNALELRSLRENLVVLRTFSKAYALAGLRVGYAVAPRRIVDYLGRVRAPFNVSLVAQAAAVAALGDREHLERSVAATCAERARLAERLTALGVAVTPSQANFIYFDVDRDARVVYERLLALGVIVRAFAPLPTKLRLTVGTPRENERALAALAEVLG